MDDDLVRITLRLPRDLHARLEDASAESARSLNGELIQRLQQSFEPSPSNEELTKLQAELEALRHVAGVLEGLPVIMASVVRQLIETHSKELDPERDHVVKLAKALADSVVHHQGAGMADALSALLDPKGVHGIALEMQAFKKDLRTNAAKKSAFRKKVSQP